MVTNVKRATLYGNGLPEVTFNGPNVVTFKLSPLGATSTEK